MLNFSMRLWQLSFKAAAAQMLNTFLTCKSHYTKDSKYIRERKKKPYRRHLLRENAFGRDRIAF